MNIKELLKNKVFQKETRKTTEWQELGREISEHYGRKLYYIIAPYKHDLTAVRYAFKEAKTRNMPVRYFIGMLKFKKLDK